MLASDCDPFGHGQQPNSMAWLLDAKILACPLIESCFASNSPLRLTSSTQGRSPVEVVFSEPPIQRSPCRRVSCEGGLWQGSFLASETGLHGEPCRGRPCGDRAAAGLVLVGDNVRTDSRRAAAGRRREKSEKTLLRLGALCGDFDARQIDARLPLVRRVVADPKQPVVQYQAGVTGITARG